MDSIKFMEAKLEGGWLMLKPSKEDIGKAMNFVRKIKPKVYEANLKEHKKMRSQDANAKLWAILGEMSTILHLPPEEIYQGYIPDVGGNYRIVPVKPEDIPAWEKEWCAGHIGRMIDDMGACMSKDLAGYHNIKSYRGSSEYDSATFSRLLELVMQDCRQLGIEVLSERERSLLLESIDEKRHES